MINPGAGAAVTGGVAAAFAALEVDRDGRPASTGAADRCGAIAGMAAATAATAGGTAARGAGVTDTLAKAGVAGTLAEAGVARSTGA